MAGHTEQSLKAQVMADISASIGRMPMRQLMKMIKEAERRAQFKKYTAKKAQKRKMAKNAPKAMKAQKAMKAKK